MTLEFYLKVFPEYKAQNIYELDIKETRGKMVYEYKIFWPTEHGIRQTKKDVKAWAVQERVEVVAMKGVYAEPKVRKSV